MAVALPLVLGGSCSRRSDVKVAKLSENICGLYLGETKGDLFKRARGVAEITIAPDLPRGQASRGELYNLSAPLEPYPGIDHLRLAFFNSRLWEIVVYFKDTGVSNLEWLKIKLEGQYQTRAIAPDGTIEQAYKTYRLAGPGMSITLRRITKKESTELYIQYIHDELHKELMEREGKRK